MTRKSQLLVGRKEFDKNVCLSCLFFPFTIRFGNKREDRAPLLQPQVLAAASPRKVFDVL